MPYEEILDLLAASGDDLFTKAFREVGIVEYVQGRTMAGKKLNGWLTEGGYGGEVAVNDHDPAAPSYAGATIFSNGFQFRICSKGAVCPLPANLAGFLAGLGCTDCMFSGQGHVLNINVPFEVMEPEMKSVQDGPIDPGVRRMIDDMRSRQSGIIEKTCYNCLP
ncbi:hypothetical protein HY604_05010 [Candidatus Peregrinibacteria bacterium]|nr:hypothetical protein [Candidatus Peregrinibacteria bacterium]